MTDSSLYSHSTAPTLTASQTADTALYSIGTVLKSAAGGTVTSIWFYVGTAGLGAIAGVAYVYPYNIPDGVPTTASATKTFTLRATVGWQQVTFDTAPSVAAGERFIAAVSFPGNSGYYSYLVGAFTSDVVVGDLTAEATGTVGNGRYSNDATDAAHRYYPSKAGTAWYGVDVVVSSATPLAVSAGADQSILTGQSATVTATATGGSGTRTFVWTQISGAAGTLAGSGATQTFTPSAAGTAILRAVVTDSTGSVQDDVAITTTVAPTLVKLAKINASTGWTPVGGTVKVALGDSLAGTEIVSSGNPTAVTVDANIGPVSPPAIGKGFTLRLTDTYRETSSSGTVTGKLYEGTTLRSTVTASLPTTAGTVDLEFPASDVGAVATTAWGAVVGTQDGDQYTAMRVVFSVTAA